MSFPDYPGGSDDEYDAPSEPDRADDESSRVERDMTKDW